jgi:hypothetical protein
MRFALLCHSDGSIRSNKELDDAVLEKHFATNARLRAEGRLGPVLRLMPADTAVTIRAGTEPMVIDGPFAETKEVLLGFWIFDADSRDDAVAVAKEFASHAPHGSYELRPVLDYAPAVSLPDSAITH